MAITKSAVVKLILSYIGGSPLLQIPTVKVGGSPVAIKAGGLPSGLAGIASNAANLAKGIKGARSALQAGLSSLSVNPFTAQLSNISSKVEDLVLNDFAGLDSTFSLIAANPDSQVQEAYTELKRSLGGRDGTAGVYAQLYKFQQHTDLVSGVTAPDTSEGDNVDLDNTFIYYFNMNNSVGSNSNTIIEFSKEDYRSAKFTIQASSQNLVSNAVYHQVSDIFLIHDGASLNVAETNKLTTNGNFITYFGDIYNGNVRIRANSYQPNVDFVMFSQVFEVATKAELNQSISFDSIIQNAQAYQALFPDDTTNYIELQAGSLFKQDLVNQISTTIEELELKMIGRDFEALSNSQKAAVINGIANTINTQSDALQASIDSDTQNFEDVNRQLEVASLVANIQNTYADPNAKVLIDLTSNTNFITALNQIP